MLVRGASSWLVVGRRTVSVLSVLLLRHAVLPAGPRVGVVSCHTTRVPLSPVGVVVNQKAEHALLLYVNLSICVHQSPLLCPPSKQYSGRLLRGRQKSCPSYRKLGFLCASLPCLSPAPCVAQGIRRNLRRWCIITSRCRPRPRTGEGDGLTGRRAKLPAFGHSLAKPPRIHGRYVSVVPSPIIASKTDRALVGAFTIQFKVFTYGERLVDRLDFEELALKGVDPSMGPKITHPRSPSEAQKKTVLVCITAGRRITTSEHPTGTRFRSSILGLLERYRWLT
jgi:hypothetical protein